MNTHLIICPLCNDAVDRLVYRFHYDSEQHVIDKIKASHPAWTEQDGLCSRCVDYYHTEIILEQRILPEVGPHFPIKSADDFNIIPTGLRMDANPRYTGKGVTICFIDSGFYPHPDLTATKNRIKALIDCTNSGIAAPAAENDEHAWHGTMTTVVCAGDGYAGKGLYKGIACDAELVLLKVQDEQGRITTDYLCRALQWVLQHHGVYNIKVVNLSVAGDETVSYKESRVDLLAEQLINEGITVVAAVGNDEHGTIKPPANALQVIAVGGIDDNNKLDKQPATAYHSTFGATVDNLQKPELVAPAVWIAAPVLPGTKVQEEAAILYRLLEMPGESLYDELAQHSSKINLDNAVYSANDVTFIKESIKQRIRAAKYISPHYMHVDGTSFAAPIVSAVIAQLLEVNPLLTPAMIREVLFGTAKRMEGIDSVRQGFGVVRPRQALLKVLKKEIAEKQQPSPRVNRENNTIEFFLQQNCASQVSLAGSFNNWTPGVLLMQPGAEGFWKLEIPMLPGGKYHYKFFIDELHWKEDVGNPFREPDGFGGFNSLLMITNEAIN